MKKILLVEDDKNLSFIMKENLEDLDFEVCHILKGEDSYKILENNHIDLILMDVELSGEIDGFETARIIRGKYPLLPIIFTTARTSGKDIERGFGIKNMDYVKKPFGIKEIELRINSLLKNKKNTDDIIMIGAFTFDKVLNKLYRYNQEFRLTNLESRFLTILSENMGTMVSKESLITALWGDVDDPQSKEKSIHNLVYKLRQCLNTDPSTNLELLSKQGYRIIVSNVD